MDKVKVIVYLVFAKHLFWTVGVSILIMSVFAWWGSTGDLQEQYDTNSGQITNTLSTVDQILKKPVDSVFNQSTHEGMEAENSRLAKKVYLAWRAKYEKQRDQVLVWPEGLSARFVRNIESLLKGRPIEEIEIDPGKDLVATLREEYRNQIKSLLPRLAEMINAKWVPSDGMASSQTGSGFSHRRPIKEQAGSVARTAAEEGEDDSSYTVLWSVSNQSSIEQELFDWSQTRDQLPTTIDILYSMEDYWALKALMQIIARTNSEGGVMADAQHKAAIREIDFIHIGQAVQTSNSGVLQLAGESTVTSANEPSTAGSEGEDIEMDEELALLAAGRYVNKQYQPLPAATLKSAATSENTNEAYLAVAKRMPVRMRLRMDQRKINKFLVECGNGDLMLEVKQIRVNPDQASVQNSVPGANGSSAGRPFSRGRPSPSSDETSNKYPFDVVVEVYGVIYIFNPPSIKRLGLSPEDQKTLDRVNLADAAAVEDAAAEKPSAEAQNDEKTNEPAKGAANPGDPAEEARLTNTVLPNESALAQPPPDTAAAIAG